MHNTREFSYVSCGQAFIGCPSDAERYGGLIQKIWGGLPVPGLRRNIMHWKKDYDAVASKGAEPDQYKIAKTSDPATNPVFILFAHKIGTSVRPPSRDTRDWDALRKWFNRKGWGRIAMLGDADFQDEAQVPAGKIPLSGTLYELFDAMRTGNETDLRIYDLSHIAPPPPAHEPMAGQQAQWCQQLLGELSKNFAVRAPRSESEFEENAEEDLRQAFDVLRFDPLEDALPGLDAISSKTPLLFGRGRDIDRLSARVFQGKQAAFTSVVGVSGAGKSSLMRGGLMREWFRSSPSGIGRRKGATALLVEPQLLQLDDAADPLQTLARLLTTASDKASDRVVGPLPDPLASQPPPLAPPGGDLKKDLPAVIRWWAALTKELQGPFVLILDQAEQIEAAARRAAQAEAERTGQPVAPKLSPQWRRFTGLFAALSGVLDPAYQTPQLNKQIEKVNRRRPLRLLLTLHRESALDLWPLKETLPKPVQVEPLTRQAEWQSVIENTCRAYGLTLDKRLRDSMVDEAVTLAEKRVSVRESDDAPTPITHTQASVLPQVRTALQRIITRWRELHNGKSEGEKQAKAAYTLDDKTFESCAGIAGAIEALGEEAWQGWQAALAGSKGINLASIFGQQELAQEQNRRFADLMSGLVDARDAKNRDLSKLLRDGERARRHTALVEALLTHRMLTKAGESKVGQSEDRRYLLLSHRSVLDHWSRAAQWLKQAEPRLKIKARLVNHYQQNDKAEDLWHKDHLDDFADLAVNWIGSGEGDDGDALAYLKSGLCAWLDPAQVSVRAETRLAVLPFIALSAGDRDFFGNLLEKCMTSPAWPAIAPGLVLAISEKGEVEFLETVLEGDDKAILCNTVDRETGNFPLLMAAQNGHDKAVARLLDQGAEPNRVNEKTGTFPLLLAAQNGHDKAVALLLAKGAEPDRVHKDGGFPLLMAAQNGHDKAVALLLDQGAEPDRVNEKNGTFPLLQAAQNGHDQAVALLLDKGAEPDRVNEKTGAFPLLWAAHEGHDQAVARLLDKGAEPDRVNEKTGAFPLLLAAENGRDQAVAILLAKGAEPNRVGKYGLFPLGMAAQEGHGKVVALLLDKGAEPDQVDKDGLFPLLQAAQAGHDKVVELLLDKGAEPNRVNEKSGTFPLLLAAQNGHDKAVARLLDKGAEPNRVNEKSGTFPLGLAAQEGHDKAVELLLDKGAEPDRVGKDGLFPLLMAAHNGHDKAVALLLDKGAEPDRVHKDGNFPLLMAAQAGHAKAVARLLDKGAEPDRVNEKDGTFPLLLAVHNGHDKAVALLLDKGAEPNQVNKDGTFPLGLAAQEGHDKAVALLLDKGAEPDRVGKDGLFPLLLAAHNGHDKAVALLLDKGAEPDRVHKDGNFPLLMAAQAGHAKAVARLLDKGAEPDRVNEKDGTFPLLLAVHNGHDKAVALLLDKGAEPNQVNKDGTFPLGLAAQEGHDKAVALLLDKGAEPDRVGKDGIFPLLLAAEEGHDKVVALLLDKGAETNRVNEQDGTFPLLQAAGEGHDKVVALLLDKGAEPNQVHKDGIFPLGLAAKNGHDQAAALLLDKGAEPNQVGKNGLFPLLLAAHEGHDKAVTLLLDKGADIDQRHESSSITPLAAAIAAKKSSTAALLRDRGSGAHKSPIILSGGDWPRDRASEDAGQQKQTEQDTPADWAAAIPAFPIPGRWMPAEVDERLLKGLSEIFGQLPIPPDSVKDYLFNRNLSLLRDDRLYLRQSCLAVDRSGQTVAMDFLWLDGDERFKPFLVSPGTPPLDAILEGLRDKSILPDFRFSETKMTWAALAVLLGDDVPRMPLMQDHELPLADGATKPRFSISGEAWRKWRDHSGPAGPYVQLPWIEGRDLVWGKVLTPAGVVGLRVLEEPRVLARDIDWVIPRFAVGEDGKPLPFRYLGKIEQRQQ